MQESDLTSVYELVQNTIQASYREVYPAEAIEFFKNYHQKEVVMQDAEDGYTVVAESDGVIVATGTLLGTNIKRVFVAPDLQRKGIGKIVARELIRKAKLGLQATLELDASIISARFWESLGFQTMREDFIPVSHNEKLVYYKMTLALRNISKRS
jgi:GNAT superfamily N-acetyltransferase